MENEIVKQVFDYAVVPEASRELVKIKTAEVKIHIAQAASGMIEVGKALNIIKGHVGHGNWLDWLEMEGKMSQRSAQRLIRIAEKFPNAPGLAHLNIGVESLDILSQDNTPEEVRQEAIEIGKNLIEVKNAIGHGNWLPWLDAEFGFSPSTAQNFMNVADKFPTVGNLDIAPKALYLLAQNSTPEEVRQEAIEMSESGETPTAKEIKELKSKNKELNDLIQKQSEVGYSFWLERS